MVVFGWFHRGRWAADVGFVFVAMNTLTRYSFASFAIGFGLSSIFGVVIEFQGVLVGVFGVVSGVCAAVNK
jgi:hypothetical protein